MISRLGTACWLIALLSWAMLASGADDSAAKGKKPREKGARSKPAEAKPAAADKKEKEAASAKAEEKKPEPAKETKVEPAKPTTLTVKKGPMKVEVALDGVFEAQKTAELVLRPQEWQGLTVVSAIEHGAVVKRGDVLVSLDLEKIDRALADLRTEMKTSDISIKQAEQELRTLETLTPMDLAAVDRAQKYANDDFGLYKKVIRPLNLRMVEMTLKFAKFRYDWAMDEYKQLEKMYKADDLTEETERMVLKRAEMQVEAAKFSYEAAKIEHEDQLKRDLPRADERVEEATKRINITAERTRVVLPATLEKQRLDLEKLRVARARSEDRLTKLQADRESMTVKAPIDGVVYYGSCDRGKWSASTGEELRRGATVMPNKVFMTVVQARPLSVRVSISEKQLPNVRAGMKATLKPAALPDTRLDAILERVGSVPLTGNNFDGRLTVALSDKAEALMPGMTCEVKVLAYDKKDVLTIPPAALGTDEQDDQKQFVMLVDKDGKSKRQPVKVGKKNDKQVEITSGLKDGEQILPEAPKDKTKAETPKTETKK